VAIILLIFYDNQPTKSRVFLVDPGFLSPPLKFLWSIALRSPIRWTPLTDRTDRKDNKQTDERTCLFVCVLD